MRTPDKIYYYKTCVNPSGYEQGQAYELNPDPLPCVEYIRKNALLEWVKLAYGKVSMNPFECSEAFAELINKVNSL